MPRISNRNQNFITKGCHPLCTDRLTSRPWVSRKWPFPFIALIGVNAPEGSWPLSAPLRLINCPVTQHSRCQSYPSWSPHNSGTGCSHCWLSELKFNCVWTVGTQRFAMRKWWRISCVHRYEWAWVTEKTQWAPRLTLISA